MRGYVDFRVTGSEGGPEETGRGRPRHCASVRSLLHETDPKVEDAAATSAGAAGRIWVRCVVWRPAK